MRRAMHYPVIVGLRLRPEDVQRLDELCRRTHRARADLLRMLIGQAEATGMSDVRLTAACGTDNPAVLAEAEGETR